MSGPLQPEALFNPITAAEPLTGWEILAGPLGLIAFLPLVPLIRLAARARRRTALALGGLIWLLATTGPWTTLVLLGGALVGGAWVTLLGRLVRAGRLGPNAMIALVWIGLHALAFPLWWYASPSWYPSRMAVLHNVGFAYFLLRLVAWGVDLARNPRDPLRPADTLCWLLYPVCMRLGPVLLRQEFLERLDAWRPRQPVAWKQVGERFGLFFLGVVGLGLVARYIPSVSPGKEDFFAAPQAYSTGLLLRVFYLIPIQLYLILWTYNELAAALGLWLGIRIDNNFDWLPKATSVRDFWRRWHVTVGAWLRTYIYIPVGGNRGFVPLHYAAVFAYMGVWHGAGWSFLAWGGLQALGLTVQRGWDHLRERLGRRGQPSGPLWTGVCWLLTMHFQIAAIVVFVDFDHLGTRLFGELLRRLLGGG